MANLALVNYYARLIQKESLKMEDVPDEIKDLVQRKLDGEDISESNHSNETYKEDPVIENQLLGAKAINNKTSFIDIDEFNASGKLQLDYLMTEILTNEVIPFDAEYPSNIEFEVVRVEDTYGKFKGSPIVNAEHDAFENLLKITIDSEPMVDFKSGDYILRVDLRIKSTNYEDMSMTVYVKAK